jgi:CrcB protein
MQAPQPGWSSFIAVGAGAALGAWLRWGLGLLLNPHFLMVPLGTLVANLLGGFLMGVALGLIHALPTLAPPLKLMLTTGFLGGLTTFSTFSAEGLHLVQRGEWGWLAVHTVAHVAGALLMAAAGYAAFNAWRG